MIERDLSSTHRNDGFSLKEHSAEFPRLIAFAPDFIELT